VMEGSGVVSPNSSEGTTWLRAVLEDFDALGILKWEPTCTIS